MDLFQRAECGKMMAFQLAWDSITKNRPQRPDYFIDVVPNDSNVELGEAIAGFSMPEVDVEPLRQDGDSCCEDLILAMLDLDKRYGTKSLLLGHDWIYDGTEPCEEAVDFLDSAISYGKYLVEEGGGYMEYGVSEGDYATEAEAKAAWLEFVNNEQGQIEVKVLAEMREIKQQYEMCKSMANTGFEGAKEDESTGFYASDEPFEVSWDSIMKAPLDMDSLRPFAYSPDDAEQGRVEGFHVADFVDPQTDERYPMIVSTPSYSHDFNVDIDYPPNVERGFDNTIGNKIANTNVHYYNYEEPEGLPFSMDYPAQGTVVGISPYVAEAFRRRGMAQAIYDLVSLLGYRVKASEHLSDEAQAMWNKNQGRDFDALDEQSIWQQRR